MRLLDTMGCREQDGHHPAGDTQGDEHTARRQPVSLARQALAEEDLDDETRQWAEQDRQCGDRQVLRVENLAE